MSLLKRLTRFFSSPSASSGRYYPIDVVCSRCGEKIRGQVDLHNDLSIEYGVGENENTGGPVTYFVRKGLIGEARCFQRIEVELTFDKDRRLIDRKITGGKFQDEEEIQSQ